MSGVDIHKVMADLWSNSGLDDLFKSYWPEDDREFYLTLNEEEAAPDTPFPYAVYEAPKPSIKTRMSGGDRTKNVIKDQPWTFQLFVQETDDKSAKELASELADEVMKVFGGHPQTEPIADLLATTLEDGKIINFQFQSDYGARAADGIHQWTVEYAIVADVPIMV